MHRWHSELSLMTKRWRMELANHDWEYGQDYPHCYLAPPSDAKGISCHCGRGIGTSRKNRPYGCSKPRCGICKYSKYYIDKARNNKKRQAINFELNAYA